MKKHLVFLSLGLVLVFGLALGLNAQAESDYDGQVVKMEGNPTLYYVVDGKRLVFPNSKIYQSWFTGFDDVVTLEAEDLYALPLSGNVRYRPGVMLIKITTDPKVYFVGQNGRLRWVKTEAIAKRLYGDNWNKLIDDVSDAFFTDYEIDEPIEDDTVLDADSIIDENNTIEKNRGIKIGSYEGKTAQTVRCRIAEAMQNKFQNKGNDAPRSLERMCRPVEDDDEEVSEEEGTEESSS